MEQKNKDNEYRFKIVDFNIDVLDHIAADNTVHLKDESTIGMTLVTNVPVHTILSSRENVSTGKPCLKAGSLLIRIKK